MKKIAGILLTFNLTFQVMANCSLENAQQFDLKKIITFCHKDAIQKKLDYLQDYISEKYMRCGFIENNSHDFIECQKELILFSQEVLECEGSSIRQKQMARYDEALFNDIIKEYKPAEIPEHLKSNILRMALKQQLQIEMEAYQGSILNAHAGANNKILLSAGLWAKESVLTSDEIMAFVAHELSHIKENHSLRLGCLALEWSGHSIELKEALSNFREDFSLESSRGQSYSNLSKKVEYRADELAVKMLTDSGYSPFLMGDALTKLIPKNSGGFSSGSHPEIQWRIKKAYEYAEIFTRSQKE